MLHGLKSGAVHQREPLSQHDSKALVLVFLALGIAPFFTTNFFMCFLSGEIPNSHNATGITAVLYVI